MFMLPNSYFYLVYVEKKTQQKFKISVYNAFAPCFINGDTDVLAVGGQKGKVEIWDTVGQKMIRTLEINKGWIGAQTSSNDILAIGSGDGSLQLWDVRNLEMFSSFKFKMNIVSLHLTSDLRYVTVGGGGGGEHGEGCIVMNIK